MMNFVTWLKPAPSCPLPITHPARAVDLRTTNVRETFERHAPIDYGDDYDRVHREDWLSAPGGFCA